ncbi:hypothetical protein [Absidia glauca]|uniref:WAC domain-containing protein n=1 Tax=Absidia glauca TaxID=4829 RepID=A0A168MDR2_ABSGL|nr:hypothetical protein [Absidia glauca]
MPLLKRKQFPTIDPPVLDRKDKAAKKRSVWYSPLTHEIFTDYAQYLERITLYEQPIWQCESSGRSNLTFAEALESERIEKDKVQNKIPVELQKAILQRAQFQNARLDAVVEDVHDYFANRYLPGEQVGCIWDDGELYTGNILEVPPLEDQTSDEAKYKMQLVDDDFQAMEDYIDTVPRKSIKRDRLSFSKNLLKKFLRESIVKESYLGAPWTVNDVFAERFQIDTTLPKHLEAAKLLAYSKSRKMRSLAAAERRKELAQGGSSQPTERSRMEEFRKLELQLKYPMEDLDLPSYRRNPPVADSSVVLDMSPGSGNEDKPVPNPAGDLPPRPSPAHKTVPDDAFGSFLMIWSFLNVFSRPLHLSPFSLDDFESALRCTSVDEKNELVYEIIVALLNCIIRHRLKTGLSIVAPFASLAGRPVLLASLRYPHDDDDDGDDSQHSGKGLNTSNTTLGTKTKGQRPKSLDRSIAGAEVVAIGKGWDDAPIPVGNDRQGWEDILIGCLNDLVIDLGEDVTAFDPILCSLVPRLNSTDYIEECQDQLTELRKQKIEINRDRRRLQAERNELEKRFDDVTNTSDPTTPTPAEEDSGADSDQDSANEENIDRIQKEADQVSRHETRQNMLKRKQMEREQQEAKRKKLYHQQQQEAREKSQEQRAKATARKKLETEERAVQKKLEVVERDMRKYSTLRVKPLGRDRFYNRYYYLDNIGGGQHHGSGKLFVQSPSITDLSMLLTETETPTDAAATSLCGHGGGLRFICQLMKHQGLADKALLLENGIDGEPPLEWWESFDDPDSLDELLEWMNPKGVREYLLKRELQKHVSELTAGMKKHSSEQATVETTRRSTRTKTISHYTPGSWLSYTNKLAK